MSNLIVVEPIRPAGISTTRGSGVENLLSADPKEVWVDGAAGTTSTLTIDLGRPMAIDTIFLGYLDQAVATSTWAITGGVGGVGDMTIQTTAALRVPDGVGDAAVQSHALYHGAPVVVRYIAIHVTQPAGAGRLTAGVLVVGRAFAAALGREWGSGRRPIDTGTATALASGGFIVVEGAHKREVSWTFGDLSAVEVDQLEGIAERLGETKPGLVVEDTARTAGLRRRCHYGMFGKWKGFERRNRVQTRWEISLEEWV